MTIDVRSAGNAGHGPSWTLPVNSPASRSTISCWPPGTSTSLPSSSECRPRRSKTKRIIRRSSGAVSLVETALESGRRRVEASVGHLKEVGAVTFAEHPPAGDAGQRHERADLDVVRRDLVRAAVQLGAAVHGQHVGADALDVGAHLD